MAEGLSFDEQINGIAAYLKQLRGLNPFAPDHNPVANPNLFAATESVMIETHLRRAGNVALTKTLHLARVEYETVRGLAARDLRADTPDQRAERASILAVLTCALEPEVREAKAERITTLLKRAIDGEVIEVAGHSDNGRMREPQSVVFDPSRALFVVLGALEPKESYVLFQYDSPEYDIYDPSKLPLNLGIRAAFRETDPILVDVVV